MKYKYRYEPYMDNDYFSMDGYEHNQEIENSLFPGKGGSSCSSIK